jgi:hypothetical protein
MKTITWPFTVIQSAKVVHGTTVNFARGEKRRREMFT